MFIIFHFDKSRELWRKCIFVDYDACKYFWEGINSLLKFWLGSLSVTLEYQGNQAYKEKQWEKAIGCYTEAIKLNSRNATYYSNRAAAYLELGRYIHYFKCSFRFNHSTISYRVVIVSFFPLCPFRFHQAEADCSKAIDLDKKVTCVGNFYSLW